MAYRIRILFVRHGYSCSNAYFYHSGHDATPGMPDYHRLTHLTELGRKVSATAAHDVLTEVLGRRPSRSRDFVVSSAMLRALETAVLMTGGLKVHAYPFLAEEKSTMSELPSNAREYKDILNAKNYKSNIDLSRIIDKSGHVLPSAVKSDIDKFIPVILQDLHKTTQKPENIIIFTHSHLIHNQVKGPYLYNNGIVRQYWDVQSPKVCTIRKPKKMWDGLKPPDTYKDFSKHGGMCGCDKKSGSVCLCPAKNKRTNRK